MRIKTQFIMTMLLFGVILVVIAVSAIITSERVEKAGEQEGIASGIARGASELSYLANDYLIYRESPQLKRWQSRFASFSEQVAGLEADRSEQQALVRNIRANQQRVKEVFDSVVSGIEDPLSDRKPYWAPEFLQVSWSRMAVQSQALVSDASRLSQLLHIEIDRLRETTARLIYVLVGLFGALLLAGYRLTYRRILKSMATLQAGTAVIGSGNLDFRIDEKKNDEIGDLSKAFNRMTADLKSVTASKADLEREVSERKRAEESLRQQREWLQVTLASIGDAVIATDRECRISFLNPVAAAMTGWPIEEALGRPVQELFRIINEKTREAAEDVVSRVLREGRTVALANHTALIARDGREIPIEDSAAPIKDDSGMVAGVVLVFHDVTEKRRAGEALRESEEKFRSAFANAAIGFAMMRPDGRFVDANAAFCRVTGYQVEELRSLTFQQMVHPDDLAEYMTHIDRMLAGKSTHFVVENRYLLNNGDTAVWVRKSVSLVRSVHGEPQWIIVLIENITERKQAEEALRRSERRYRSFVEVTSQFAWVTDADGLVVEDVPTLRNFTGQTYEQAKGGGWAAALHPEDLQRTLEVWNRAVSARMLYEIEYRMKRHDGLYRSLLARGVPILDDEGNVVEWVGTCIDITEQEAAQEALQKAHAQLQEHARKLEETNKELEGFAYTISHDLRAPLRAINGFARMLADDYGSSLEEEGRRRLGVIETNAVKMGLLIDDLLAFSRAGRTALNTSSIEMNGLVTEVVETLKTSNAGSNPAIRVSALPAAQGDRSLIRQVLANLLENSVKFSRNRPYPEIEVGSFEQDGEQVYFVKDNGVGFDMKYHGKLFGVFQRLVTDAEFEGTGVGLAIVHRLVTRHGGRVWAEAGSGKGATFFFTLKRKGDAGA